LQIKAVESKNIQTDMKSLTTKT